MTLPPSNLHLTLERTNSNDSTPSEEYETPSSDSAVNSFLFNTEQAGDNKWPNFKLNLSNVNFAKNRSSKNAKLLENENINYAKPDKEISNSQKRTTFKIPPNELTTFEEIGNYSSSLNFHPMRGNSAATLLEIRKKLEERRRQIEAEKKFISNKFQQKSHNVSAYKDEINLKPFENISANYLTNNIHIDSTFKHNANIHRHSLDDRHVPIDDHLENLFKNIGNRSERHSIQHDEPPTQRTNKHIETQTPTSITNLTWQDGNNQELYNRQRSHELITNENSKTWPVENQIELKHDTAEYGNSLDRLNNSLSELQGQIMHLSLQQDQMKCLVVNKDVDTTSRPVKTESKKFFLFSDNPSITSNSQLYTNSSMKNQQTMNYLSEAQLIHNNQLNKMPLINYNLLNNTQSIDLNQIVSYSNIMSTGSNDNSHLTCVDVGLNNLNNNQIYLYNNPQPINSDKIIVSFNSSDKQNSILNNITPFNQNDVSGLKHKFVNFDGKVNNILSIEEITPAKDTDIIDLNIDENIVEPKANELVNQATFFVIESSPAKRPKPKIGQNRNIIPKDQVQLAKNGTDDLKINKEIVSEVDKVVMKPVGFFVTDEGEEATQKATDLDEARRRKLVELQQLRARRSHQKEATEQLHNNIMIPQQNLRNNQDHKQIDLKHQQEQKRQESRERRAAIFHNYMLRKQQLVLQSDGEPSRPITKRQSFEDSNRLSTNKLEDLNRPMSRRQRPSSVCGRPASRLASCSQSQTREGSPIRKDTADRLTLAMTSSGGSDSCSDIGDYSSGSLKLFVKPSERSNKHIIINAIKDCCLAGVVNQPIKTLVLELLEQSECRHFVVLLREVGLQYRALYTNHNHILKLHGNGPKIIQHQKIEKFFKYNSGGKAFSEILSTKHLSSTIDAIVIQTTQNKHNPHK